MERRIFFSNVCQSVVLEEEEAQVETAPHYYCLFRSLSPPALFEKNTLLRNITFSPQGKYISWKVVGALLREKVWIHGRLPPHLHFIFFPQLPFFFFLALRMSTRETFLKAVATLGFIGGSLSLWSSLYISLSISLFNMVNGFFFICFALWHFIWDPGLHLMPHYITQVGDWDSYE